MISRLWLCETVRDDGSRIEAKRNVIAFDHGILSSHSQIRYEFSVQSIAGAKRFSVSINLVVINTARWMDDACLPSLCLGANVINFIFPVACISQRNNFPLIKWFFCPRATHTHIQQTAVDYGQNVTFFFFFPFRARIFPVCDLLQLKNA